MIMLLAVIKELHVELLAVMTGLLSEHVMQKWGIISKTDFGSVN